MASKMKKKTGATVKFSDDVGRIPEDILEERYYKPFDINEDPFCQSLGGKSSLTLQRCARIVQTFIRENISHWQHFNEEKSRIYEDMDNVLLMKQGELERVDDFLVEMKREAKVEVMTELGGGDDNDDNDNDEHHQELKKQMDAQKQEVKAFEAENARLKKDAEQIKKKNKKLAMETFALYESFTQMASDVKVYETERKRLEHIQQKFEECIKALKGMRKTLKGDAAREGTERLKLQDCISKIIAMIQQQQHNKQQHPKLIDKLLKIQSSAVEINNSVVAH